MEDSGIDSDNKSNQNTSSNVEGPPLINTPKALQTDDEKLIVRKASELQKKLDKQREKNRRKQVVDSQPKRPFLLARNRLHTPGKLDTVPLSQDQQPLVAIVSDDSEEDEFAVPRLSKEAQREITEQLIKDGYNLDLEPDDEDLDLIPPRPLHERCACCPSLVIPKGCAIQ